MKRTLSALTIATLAGALVASGGTMAASASTVTNGPVHVFVYGDSFGVGATAVLTGAIGDSGTAESIDANGTPDPTNNTEELLDLVQGSFRVSSVQQFPAQPPHLLGQPGRDGLGAHRGRLGHRSVHGHHGRVRPYVFVGSGRAKVRER
jgi:hypothetical protein